MRTTSYCLAESAARTTEDIIKLVPDSYREGSVALGARDSTTILKVVVPAAFTGILTGVLLAVARISGETAPLLFTALNNRLYFDELYRKLFINPLQRFADSYSGNVDKGFIDVFLHAAYTVLSDIAEAFKWFDKKVVTGISDLVGNVFRRVGHEGRELQTGQVQNYLLSALIAAVVMMVFFLVFQ